MKLEKALSISLILGLLILIIALVIVIFFFIIEPPKLPSRAELADENLNIKFYSDQSYVHPGEISNFYFQIVNKRNETVKRIDINLKISYFGKTVYEKNGASIRDFKHGEIVTISTNETVPIMTPPGDYLLQFYFRPENQGERHLEYRLYVQPSAYQISLLLLLTIIFGLLIYFIEIKKVFKLFITSSNFIKKNFELFTAGQKVIFMGIVILILAASMLAFGLKSLVNEFAIIAYFLFVIGIVNNLLEYIKWGDPKVTYTLSTYALSAVVYLSMNYGLSTIVGEVATTFSSFWAVSTFLQLSNKERRTALKISVFPISLWIIFNLMKGAIPYYSTTALLIIIIYLSGKKFHVSSIIRIMDLLIKRLSNIDGNVCDTIIIYLLSSLLFFSESSGPNELVGKIIAVFAAAWATFNFPELTTKQRRTALKIYSVILLFWIIFNLAIGSMSSYSAGALLLVLTVFLLVGIVRKLLT
jgi:hypothetical protein